MQSSPRRLGRYEVTSLLARGGMAELFLARLPGIEGFAVQVVIKRVLPQLAADRDFVEMFLEEARLAATLHHQNIVAVHDIDHDADGYFFAMEHLHGADLGELLRATDGDLPLAVALEIARGACAGLHHAHERRAPAGGPLGIVHRDVSPQNIFVTFDGGVKLLDFGIAKAVQQSPSHYTRSGTLRGKLPYMSPEQCRGVPIDRRSDVFSLAVVLWEMTVGQRLFGAHRESDFEILKSIVERDAPRPTAAVPAYPPALEAIVMKGLARDRDRRYQTCDELQGELEAFMRAGNHWATARDLSQYMTRQFADRAASSARLAAASAASDPAAAGGEIVPFPRATRLIAPAPSEMTIDLPRPGAVNPGARRAHPTPGPASAAWAPAAAAPPIAAPAPAGVAAASPGAPPASGSGPPPGESRSPAAGFAATSPRESPAPDSGLAATPPGASPAPGLAASPGSGAVPSGAGAPSSSGATVQRSPRIALAIVAALAFAGAALAIGFWLGRGRTADAPGASSTSQAPPPHSGAPTPAPAPAAGAPAAVAAAPVAPPSGPGSAGAPPIARSTVLGPNAEVSGTLEPNTARRHPFSVAAGRYYVELLVKAPDPPETGCSSQPKVALTVIDREEARVGDNFMIGTWDRDNWEKRRATYDLAGAYQVNVRASECRVLYRIRVLSSAP